MDKMRIPDKFVQHYITEEHLNSNMAYISSPPGKFWRIGLEKDRSGVFFCGGWLQFLSFHGVSQGDVLLLRYRGNLVFKVEFFGPNGCRKDLKTDDTRVQQCEQTDAGIHQDEPFRRRKCIEKKRKIDEDNGNQHGTASSSGRKDSIKKRRTDGSERERRKKSQSIYEIGPPSWIKKKINEYILERCLVSLALTFCSSIGFAKKSTITLTMEMEMTSRGGGGGGNSSRRRSWEVAGRRYSHACYLLGDGWKRFCHDNGLKVGDVCVFTVVHTTLWHVGIERC
ncbi:putative B3 domain-containing protein Os04g0346900 [Oryza brachyantha]|uniref:putative B3 domain-containing protein Os04g0346900 n=1 Tax=Oryza brachyantha TaxID=4533 RepID=UPI001ADAED10|nr:putative B3 domain-containing protein Os04g0346900 [Oryza brachyantha]